MVRNSIIEYDIFEFKSFSQQVSTSPNLEPLVRISMQLGDTFPHWVDKEKREEVPSSSFRRGGGNWGHDFILNVCPITQETVYPPFNMHTTLILLYIFTNEQFAWNVSHIFQDCLLIHVPESFNPESHHFIPLFNKVCYTQWPCH
jgi:hypothetical protein